MKYKYKNSNGREVKKAKPISKAEFAAWVIAYSAALFSPAKTLIDYYTGGNGNAGVAQVVSASESSYDRPVRELEQIEVPQVQTGQKGLEKSVASSLYNMPGLKRISAPHLYDGKTRKPIVVLDPGHGMANAGTLYDSGAVAKDANGKVIKDNFGNPICEANIVLGQAAMVRDILKSRGYEVYETREDETTSTPIRSRVPFADAKKADIMVSLHLNGSDVLEAKGEEVYYQNEKKNPENASRSRVLARNVERLIFNYVNQNPKFQAVSREIKPRSNVKGDRLEVLTGKRPSVLIESGFVTNVVGDKADIDYLAYDRMKYVALAIADAIDAYVQKDVVPRLYAEQQAKVKPLQTRSNTRTSARVQAPAPQLRPTSYAPQYLAQDANTSNLKPAMRRVVPNGRN